MESPPDPSAHAPPPKPSPAVVDSSSIATSVTNSVDSSFADPNTEDLHVPAKLRLMCSYGGHIVPRPHDKSLCYVGGETRIVVVDRDTSFTALSERLSNSILNGRRFTLKYQLPNEDLDSLISVATDEDLENMIDEYDRTSSLSTAFSRPSRLRLFLFLPSSDATQSVGPILENSVKSECWFVNALNGAGGLLNRGFSEPDTVNCLLGLGDDAPNTAGAADGKQVHDAHSVPDSPLLGTASSFGSTSSSSVANLPRICTHADDNGGNGSKKAGGDVLDQMILGIEEQFAQINSAKKHENFVNPSSTSNPGTPIMGSREVTGSSLMANNNVNSQTLNDEESSDTCGIATQPESHQNPSVQMPEISGIVTASATDLPSPDSVSSESHQRPVISQDPSVGSHITSGEFEDSKAVVADKNAPSPIRKQVHEPGYVIHPHFQQQPQQFMHPGSHYVHHLKGAVPMTTCYPPCPNQQCHHYPPHSQLEHQFPVYYIQAMPPQPYNVTMPSAGIEVSTAIPASGPPAAVNIPVMPSPSPYTAIQNTSIARPEVAPLGMYRATTGPQHLYQVPHPNQSTATAELVDASRGQMFYAAQPLIPTMPPQYQTVPPVAPLILAEPPQQAMDNLKQPI